MKRLALFASLLSFILLGSLGGACGPEVVVDSCGTAITCPDQRSYQLCTADQATSAYYLGSDGSRFTCVSASDCQQARTEVTDWCETGIKPSAP